MQNQERKRDERVVATWMPGVFLEEAESYEENRWLSIVKMDDGYELYEADWPLTSPKPGITKVHSGDVYTLVAELSRRIELPLWPEQEEALGIPCSEPCDLYQHMLEETYPGVYLGVGRSSGMCSSQVPCGLQIEKDRWTIDFLNWCYDGYDWSGLLTGDWYAPTSCSGDLLTPTPGDYGQALPETLREYGFNPDEVLGLVEAKSPEDARKLRAHFALFQEATAPSPDEPATGESMPTA